MLTFVVICNLLITLLNFFLAWQIWQWRQKLALVAQTLNRFERSTHRILSVTPEVLDTGEKATSNLRERYQRLELQLERLAQVIRLVVWAYRLWQKQTISQVNPKRVIRKKYI